MKNLIQKLSIAVCLLMCVNISYAINPTFELRITNGVYTSSNEGYFDFVMKHTNYPAADFLFGGAEYVIELNTSNIPGSVIFREDTATYNSIYENRIRHQATTVSRVGNNLRIVTSSVFLKGEIISHTTGTLCVRIKFINQNLYSTSCFLNYGNFIWKTSGAEPISHVYSFNNDSLILLPNAENQFVDAMCFSLHACCLGVPPIPPVRISPANNSENLSLPVSFTWNRSNSGLPGITYRIQVSDDSLFNSIRVDSTFSSSESIVTFITDKVNYNSVYYWRVKCASSFGTIGAYTEKWKFTTSPAVSVNLTLIPEGYYLQPSHPSFFVKANLRNITSPFALVDSSTAMIPDSTWSANFNFLNAESGRYYIEVKHFNTIETWSRLGGDTLIKGFITNYDFSSSASQAYGNNLELIGSVYCIFSGDVDQNGAVNGADNLLIYNDALNFVSGYLASDINGDNTTTLTDLLIAYNNSVNFVIKITP